MPGETVQPSSDPGAAAATGTVDDQHGSSAHGDAPYDLADDGPRDDEQPPPSPSGT